MTGDLGANAGRAPVVSAPLVSARGLVKSYGSGRAARRVLDEVDLDVAPGELLAVVGRSGSGKSTLLHLLGGLDRADAGSITVNGVRIESLSQAGLTELRRHQVGFVFQSFHLLPELSGFENVILPGRLAGDGTRAAARARSLIESLELGEAAARLPDTLSGGEQQRLAIARALVNDPALVLADEPTGNLDAESAAIVLGLLRRIAAGPRAVVLVTHDVEATALADRVIELRDGRPA
ncbi:MAG: ABC transporter ATP-binding protein [Gaiellaceae bacterium MAG52_C11]|nr:ABC transporter ATP-binding protein [Candidatus Gaiellasilicea maunaloa]